jgi:hypothetical protein
VYRYCGDRRDRGSECERCIDTAENEGEIEGVWERRWARRRER